MNERDDNIIISLTAYAGAYAAILHSTKSSKKKRGVWGKKLLMEQQKKGAYNGIVWPSLDRSWRLSKVFLNEYRNFSGINWKRFCTFTSFRSYLEKYLD